MDVELRLMFETIGGLAAALSCILPMLGFFYFMLWGYGKVSNGYPPAPLPGSAEKGVQSEKRTHTQEE